MVRVKYYLLYLLYS